MVRGDSAFALRDYGVTSLPSCCATTARQIRLCAMRPRRDEEKVKNHFDSAAKIANPFIAWIKIIPDELNLS
jgi:hypothetical protein